MGSSPAQRYPVSFSLLNACKMNEWLCSVQLGKGLFVRDRVRESES